MKILDFTTLLPGPYATMMLADMGADVLRIVSGSRPDALAYYPPFIPGTDLSAAHAYLGRGKRCMTLNLKDSRSVQIVHRLIESYDILIEQFRPGVMEKFGLDYSRLNSINPAIIYCSITGYGQTGPLRNRAGHDINFLARSGVISYSGRKETGPALTGMQIADIASGSYNAIVGILSAVVSRKASGKGQQVDISMADGTVALNAITAAAFLADGTEPGPEGTILNGGSLYDFYETKDGRHIGVGSIEPPFFAAFCRTIDCPELIAGGIAPPDVEQAKRTVREAIKSKTREEWMELFDKVDACVEPVLSLSEALKDAHTLERKLVVDVELPDGGSVKQPAVPIKFSATPQEYGKAGVLAGTHNCEVLLELGYRDEEIEEFEKSRLFK
jgi:crotonobetainyl-CoA:carnitine CoA-transferase CaiB-like acyl-CoA transferase